jgi:putative hemin transport protein
MGVAVNPDIDLRFLMNEWKYALAVTMDRGAGKKLYGFQFYNKRGEAIHKVYTTPKSNLAAYHILVDRYAAKEQSPILSVDRSPISEKEMVADESIDIAGFQEGWKNLKDTHDFFGLLRKYNVRRDQGLRLAPANFTCKVDNKTIVKVLEEAALIEVPIMCFVHSKGCIQIHTGAIKNLKSYGDWYNILDEEFNLHLDLPKVDQTWIVKKPTVDGIVTSIELFDKNGALITYFFGARKPGKPELKAWTSIMENQLLVEK